MLQFCSKAGLPSHNHKSATVCILYVFCGYIYIYIYIYTGWFTTFYRKHEYSAQGQVLHSGTQAAVLLGLYRCGSFPLLSTPHSLFSIWTDLQRSEKIPGAPTWRWVEWIWLSGPSGLRLNSPQGLNIGSIRVFDQIRDPEIPTNLRPRVHDKDGYDGQMILWELVSLKLPGICLTGEENPRKNLTQ